MSNQSPIMTPEEVAQYLRIGRDRTYGLIRDGTIPSVDVGGRRRVHRSDVDAYLERLRLGVAHAHAHAPASPGITPEPAGAEQGPALEPPEQGQR